MKKILTTLFLIISLIGFTQKSGKIDLNWTIGSKIPFESFEFKTPFFQMENFELKLSEKQILFNLIIQDIGYANEKSLKISNLTYESINLSQLGDLDLNLISELNNSELINLEGRDNFSSLIKLSPIIKEGTSYKIIKSFEYSFDLENPSKISRRPSGIISNSVLAAGSWYRFYIQKSGVYFLNKAFLKQLGIPIENVDPRNIRIYGNGGRMLPLKNSTFYPDDLTENAIQILGEADGIFNDSDAILFYGEGVDNWSEENLTFGNLYEDKSYYYVNFDLGAGKRIPEMIQPTGSPTTTFTTFDDEIYKEVDLVNIGKLGRRWYGESFKINNIQNFNFNIPNTVAGSQINLKVAVASKSSIGTNFKLEANNVNVGNLSIQPSDIFNFLDSINSIAASDNVSVKLTYNNLGVPTSEGYLDYISLKSKRNLTGYGKQFRFQNNLSASGSGIVNYQISNAANIKQIWNITDIWNVSSISNNLPNISFNSSLGSLQKFIGIDYNDLYTPLKDANVRIGNQNLKGSIFLDEFGIFQDIDYLIITPAFLNPQAQKLANFHRSYSNLSVRVVNLEAIYNEFSSGKQDIAAIRNLIKYVYNNATDPSKKVKYINLFGDATYDFKNYNNRTKDNTNIVPIYHSITSNSAGNSSFASDDFFGIMGANGGNMNLTSDDLDIAVGRMIVSTPVQAEQMVNKVLEYHDKKSAGNWRNSYVFIGDDPSNQAGYTGDNSLQYYQNKLADEVTSTKPFMNVNKILLDAYQQKTTAGGDRYPQARIDLFNYFEKGALVFNYLGHGSEDGLAQEGIWQKTDGINLFNRFRYPLFITLTCDFSRFDNPTRKTAGEFVYWNPTGGAIAMVTTTRTIGQNIAETFNTTFNNKLLPAGNNYPTIAEALRLAKNGSAGNLTDVFYIGDPALKLAIPKPKVVLTKVNDMPITGPIDDLKSLGFVKISGEIQDENNTPTNDYNGSLSVNIYDKNIPRVTLRNDFFNAIVDNGSGGTTTAPVMPFVTLGETIFRGNASVVNGKFDFGFVVPRDIRIPLGNGKISFYAQQNNTLLDNSGFDTSIKIGGVNTLAVADTTPPTVRLYMNDETFVNGGITNESPIFLAFLEDENGINTASGIGHDIIAYLDGKETLPYTLNDYYETEPNNYKKGKLRYQFRNLSLGLHTLTFKAFDVYNNPITAELQFIVVGNETLTLTNVLNYPNPFVSYTQFWFTHNRPLEPLEVQVQVLTITGKVVWTKNETITTTGFLSREISWDGKDDFGDRIGKGVYVYKLTVKSALTDSVTEKYEKLVIL
jgi:Peptidase family C25